MTTVHQISIEGGPSFECAEGENLVVAAERSGWALPASCRAGICGTCEGSVCDGSFVVPGRNDEACESFLRVLLPALDSALFHCGG